MTNNEKTKKISLEDVQRYKRNDFNRLNEELLDIYNKCIEPELKSIIYKPNFNAHHYCSEEFETTPQLLINFSFVYNNDKFTYVIIIMFADGYFEYSPTSIVSSFIYMTKRFVGINDGQD